MKTEIEKFKEVEKKLNRGNLIYKQINIYKGRKMVLIGFKSKIFPLQPTRYISSRS